MPRPEPAAADASPQATSGPQIVWQGRHLHMARDGRWEFATRPVKRPAVGIVAVTDQGALLLVEQHRPPVGGTVVELPAGLAGDLPGAEQEPLVEAARRELQEETGYEAQRWTELGMGYSSPGLTDESIMLFLAEGLRKTGPGGGDGDESIVVHEVPLPQLDGWLADRAARIDFKVYAGVYLARRGGLQ